MRTQYCREHIKTTAEKCGLADKTVEEILRVAGFVEEHTQICDLSTNAVKPLIAIPDAETRDKAIVAVKKALDSKKNPKTGRFVKKITKKDVEHIVENASPFKPASSPEVAVTVVPKKEEPKTEPPIMYQDPIKQNKVEREFYASELLKRMPATTKTMVADLLRDNVSWKEADAFYFGIQALSEKEPRGKQGRDVR